MPPCSFCGTTILFAGIRHGDGHYCSETCADDGQSTHLSQSDVDLCAAKIHQASCPRCQGSGPLDLYLSHRVISALVVSYRESLHTLGCAQCGRKAQLRDLLYTLLGGWWSLSGLIWTPITIVRNVAAMGQKRDPFSPSLELRTMARRQLGRDKQGDPNSLTAVLNAERTAAKAAIGITESPRSKHNAAQNSANAFLAAQTESKKSNAALASLICGIVSLFLGFLVGIPCGIAAIVLGTRAIRQLDGGFGSHVRIMSITGIILGVLGALMQATILLFIGKGSLR